MGCVVPSTIATDIIVAQKLRTRATDERPRAEIVVFGVVIEQQRLSKARGREVGWSEAIS